MTNKDCLPPVRNREGENTSFTVGVVGYEDVDDFSEVMQKVIKSMDHRTYDENERQSRTRDSQYYKNAIESGNFVLIAARDQNGQIVSVLEAEEVVFEGNTISWLHFIGSLSDYQKKGITRRVFDDYERDVCEKGSALSIVAYVDDANADSLAFHEAVGLNNPFDEDEDGRWYYKYLK